MVCPGMCLSWRWGDPPIFGKGLVLFPWVPSYFPDRRMQDVPGPASSNLCREITSTRATGMQRGCASAGENGGGMSGGLRSLFSEGGKKGSPTQTAGNRS